MGIREDIEWGKDRESRRLNREGKTEKEKRRGGRERRNLGSEKEKDEGRRGEKA